MVYLGDSVVISGCNRGIGLAIAEHIVEEYPEVTKIYAGTRDPSNSKDLDELASKYKKIQIVQLDVTDDTSIRKAAQDVAKDVGDGGLSLLINNAGIAIHNGNTPMNPVRENILRVYNVNVLGAAMLTAAFLPLLQKAATRNSRPSKVVNISSGMGSRIVNAQGLFNTDFAYSASKAALNMYTHVLSVSPLRQQLITLSICPGHVRTGMGGPDAPLSTSDSVPLILKNIAEATSKDSGRYMHHTGVEIQP
ncbi:hypothetical protein M3Y95_00901300 [Aphelenchoides besseyi]|nr:hypothetical protein M3Y95_00901300 [Aphelenchoides besseyi]